MIATPLCLYGNNIPNNQKTVKSAVASHDQISDFEARFALARILSHHKETEEASVTYYEVLLNEKDLPFEALDHPIIKHALKSIKGASAKSRTIVPRSDRVSDFGARLTLARIYSHKQATEEAALTQYAWLLARKPDHVEATIEMGRLYISMKRIQEGLNLLYSALQKKPQNLKLLIATAQEEVAAGHARIAKSLFLKAFCVSEESDTLLIEYADAMMMWGDFFRAEEIFRAALKKKPCSLDLYLKLAWSLVSLQQYEEAEGIYRNLLLIWPNNPKILEALTRLKVQEKDFDAAYEVVEILVQVDPTNPKYLQLQAEILFMQYYLAGDCVEGAMFLENMLCYTNKPEELEEWAKLYIQNSMPEIALEIYEVILKIDPEYFPAQIGRAEMLSVLFYYTEAIEIYQSLLDIFPQNAKLMIAVARALGWSKNYDQSIQYYDEIINMNPNDPVLYREKARTALWGKQFALAMATYDQLLEAPVDNYSDHLIQESIVLEKRAKNLVWNKRYIHSLDACKELLDFNPGNEEALFDYAQSYCILGRCDYSREVYANILHIDPSHNIAKIALSRNEMRSNIGLQGTFSYWKEIGSGTFSQSQIARYRLDTVFEQPLSCRSHVRFIQQEYVENPFYNFKFYPAEGQTIEADCVFNEYVSGFVSASYKTYFHQFKSTISSHNRLSLNMQDYFQMALGCNNEDEIYNYFSLKQAIQSINSWVTVFSNITRYWSIGGTYQYYLYNDHNNQKHLNLITEYQFSEDPNVFKIILEGNYRNTAHQSVLILTGPILVDVIHPYWTPDEYFSGSITLEYRHDYRNLVFCEAPQRYIDLKITSETDSVDNPSIQAVLEWKHEFDTHWGFELKGLIHRSKQWNAEGAWGTISYRF